MEFGQLINITQETFLLKNRTQNLSIPRLLSKTSKLSESLDQ